MALALRRRTEYLVCPARHLTRKPARLSHVEAAGLPLVVLTAWQALVDTADVRPGQRVHLHAAAGGVGHVAVQIAKPALCDNVAGQRNEMQAMAIDTQIP